ncbi:signal peptidase I [Thermophilibacter sp.]
MARPKHARAEARGGRLGWWAGTLALGVALAVVLRLFVIGAYYVPSGSMLDTIHEGDLVLGERVTLGLSEPAAGDVVTFDSPLTEGETLVKRVVAVGGQTIDLVDGAVYVDGESLDEPYVRLDPATGAPERTDSLSDLAGSAGISYPYTVPEGMVWVMGDNRTNSKDSRYFGPVSVDDVTSRALLIYWPLQDARLL